MDNDIKFTQLTLVTRKKPQQHIMSDMKHYKTVFKQTIICHMSNFGFGSVKLKHDELGFNEVGLCGKKYIDLAN